MSSPTVPRIGIKLEDKILRELYLTNQMPALNFFMLFVQELADHLTPLLTHRASQQASVFTNVHKIESRLNIFLDQLLLANLIYADSQFFHCGSYGEQFY